MADLSAPETEGNSFICVLLCTSNKIKADGFESRRIHS